MPTKRGDMWEGRLKLGGRVVKTRRFDTKRAAAQWERRQRAAFDEHGYDPRLGKVPVEDLIKAWLEQREGKATKTTRDTARYLHHLGDYADRTALQLLNNAPPAPRPRRRAVPRPKSASGQLAPLSAFGGSPPLLVPHPAACPCERHRLGGAAFDPPWEKFSGRDVRGARS
jgi:hypothetical protein